MFKKLPGLQSVLQELQMNLMLEVSNFILPKLLDRVISHLVFNSKIYQSQI